MKKVLITAIIIIATAGMATATVVGTLHDLSGNTGPGVTTNVNRVCVFCHTPHQAALAAAQQPLWNHELSAHAAYGVYTSDTLDAVPVNIGGAVAGSASVSNLCMSCHDGTVAVHTLYNDPNEVAGVNILAAGPNVTALGIITGDPLVGTSLVDDHPINFLYNAALVGLDNELVLPDSAAWVDAAMTVPLFAGMVQCASCHDPHEDTNVPFMVKSNVSSALCTTCHIK